MLILRNHNASVAACYGCLAGLKLASGEVAEALVYGIAVRTERHGPPPAAGR